MSKGIIRLADVVNITYYDETKKNNDKGIMFYLRDGSYVCWEGFCCVKCEAFIEFMKEYVNI